MPCFSLKILPNGHCCLQSRIPHGNFRHPSSSVSPLLTYLQFTGGALHTGGGGHLHLLIPHGCTGQPCLSFSLLVMNLQLARGLAQRTTGHGRGVVVGKALCGQPGAFGFLEQNSRTETPCPQARQLANIALQHTAGFAGKNACVVVRWIPAGTHTPDRAPRSIEQRPLKQWSLT